MRFAFIAARTGTYPVRWMCRRLGVSTSGYYAWCSRAPSAHARHDAVLLVLIKGHHRRSHERYGSPRIHRDLRDAGEHVSRKRVARIMRENGILGRLPKRWKRTTITESSADYAPNLVAQSFTADQPNQLWMADITYLRTWAGWMYLAVVIDAFSRRVVGYAVDDHMRAELPIAALDMATRKRRPRAGLVHHSDRGSQYNSEAYKEALDKIGALQSMSSTGNCFDNAAAESFFATLKEELIYRHSWPTKSGVAASVAEYIDDFYNLRRRHSTLGNVSPVEYELGAMLQVA